MRRALAGLGVLIGGCMPYVTTYVHVDTEGVIHPRGRCGYAVPPNHARFEREGVQFELRLEHIHRTEPGPYLTLRAGADKVLSMPGATASMRFDDRGEVRSVQLEPWWTTREPDGRLVSHDALGERRVYRFGFVDLPPIEGGGVLDLPPLTVNGTALPPQRVRFERRTHAVIAPLNC